MGLWSTASGSDNLCTTHTYKNPNPQIRRSLSRGSGLVMTLSFEGRERVFVSKIRNHFDRGMCRGGGRHLCSHLVLSRGASQWEK